MHSDVYKMQKILSSPNNHKRSQIVSKGHIKYKAKTIKSNIDFRVPYQFPEGIYNLKQAMRQVKYIDVEHSNSVLTNFGITLIIYEVLMVICFGIFVRMQITPPADLLDHERPVSLLSINFMLLLGFGFMMTVAKNYWLSSLVYTLLVMVISLQLYILIRGFWVQVFSLFSQQFYVLIDQKMLIQACYCVASGLIALSAIIGRLNPTDLIKMITIHVLGYGLLEQIVYTSIGAYDAGGSCTVHTYGAYFGLTVNLVLARYVLPKTRPERNYYSNLWGLMGTLFLWVFWPFFNFGIFAANSYERTTIITNTYCSLTGSAVGAFIVTAMHGKGILIEDLQHATLVGGVAIAASCGVVYIPAISLTIGFLGGIISTNLIHYLNRKVEKSFKLVDPHCVHSTHGIPGFVGVVVSGIIIMIYSSGVDTDYTNNFSVTSLFKMESNMLAVGGLQILAGLSALLIGVGLGFVAGKFIGLFYEEKEEMFFEDCTYFDRNLFLGMEDREIRYEEAPEKKKEKKERKERDREKDRQRDRDRDREMERRDRHERQDRLSPRQQQLIKKSSARKSRAKQK